VMFLLVSLNVSDELAVLLYYDLICSFLDKITCSHGSTAVSTRIVFSCWHLQLQHPNLCQAFGTIPEYMYNLACASFADGKKVSRQKGPPRGDIQLRDLSPSGFS